jgi:hypothetical protein
MERSILEHHMNRRCDIPSIKLALAERMAMPVPCHSDRTRLFDAGPVGQVGSSVRNVPGPIQILSVFIFLGIGLITGCNSERWVIADASKSLAIKHNDERAPTAVTSAEIKNI